jgi:hypothetical protein
MAAIAAQVSALGLRLQAETWLDLSERLFLFADATYGTAFQEYWSLARIGSRARPRLSLGLEGARSATRNIMQGAAAVSCG